MIEVTCSACSKTIATADSAAGKKGKCPQCGAAIQVPDNTPQPSERLLDKNNSSVEASRASSPGWKRSKATERAMEAALKAMDEKESARGRPKSSTRVAYDLGTSSRKSEIASDSSGKAAKKVRPSQPPESATDAPILKRKLGPREFKLIGAVAAGIVLLFVIYQVAIPGEFVAANQQRVFKLKEDADRLASTGKVVEAYDKYQAIFLATKNEKLNSRLQKVVDETNAARAQLRGPVEEIQSRARLARSRSK